MKYVLWGTIVAAILLAAGCQHTIHRHHNPNLVKVTRVPGADSIQLADGRIIYYAGVTTPPKGSPFYRQALRANQRLVGNAWVLLKEQQQRANREIIAHVYRHRGGKIYTDINAELVEHGVGRVNRQDPLKAEFLEKLLQKEAQAQRKRQGIWRQQ